MEPLKYSKAEKCKKGFSNLDLLPLVPPLRIFDGSQQKML